MGINKDQNCIPQGELEEQLRLYKAIYDNTSEGVIITDAYANILSVNGAFTSITGYTIADVEGKNPRVLKSGKQSRSFYEELWESLLLIGKWNGEIINQRKDKSLHPNNLTLIAVKNDLGCVCNYIGIFCDPSPNRDTEAFFKHIATHDPLTNLPNRSCFYDYLEDAIYEAKIHQHPMAIMFVDLDNFKMVNDNYGHEVGDRLLQDLSDRLLASVGENDTVARMGGDEFTIILRHVNSPETASTIARKILETITQPFIFDEQQVQITASIGISIFPNDGDNTSNLLKYADRAMYKIKETGKNGFHFFKDLS